ncbi:hypothetical protein C1H46_001235 [Malus baccata]|uniref:Uncharacterized protein n=1 Tax=Malus baccata TaxID=106549 RepID=A0A540NQ52_MALBA|nr:hypothetical protein C1H46_001235 [Malus baccata]
MYSVTCFEIFRIVFTSSGTVSPYVANAVQPSRTLHSTSIVASARSEPCSPVVGICNLPDVFEIEGGFGGGVEIGGEESGVDGGGWEAQEGEEGWGGVERM